MVGVEGLFPSPNLWESCLLILLLLRYHLRRNCCDFFTILLCLLSLLPPLLPPPLILSLKVPTGCVLSKPLNNPKRLALFRGFCDKRQSSRKNKFDKLSGMFPALVFVAF